MHMKLILRSLERKCSMSNWNLIHREAVIAEAGNFMMMDNGIKMDTIFGDGSKQNEGFLGKVLGAGKRLLPGKVCS